MQGHRGDVNAGAVWELHTGSAVTVRSPGSHGVFAAQQPEGQALEA